MSLKLKKTKDPEQQRLYASLTALGQSLDALSSEEDLTHDEPEDPVAELGATRTRLRLYAKSERPYSSLSALARKLHRHKSEEDAGGLTAATSLHDVVTTLTAQMTSTSRELRATAPDLRAKASDLRARTRTLEASSDSDNAPTDLNDLRARAHALEDAMQAAEEAAKAVDRATQGIKEKVEAMMAAERCLNSTKELVEHMVLGNTGDIVRTSSYVLRVHKQMLTLSPCRIQVASLLYLSTIILPIFTQCWHTSRPAALAFSLPLTIFFTLNMRKWFTKGFWSRDSVEEDLAGWPGQLMSALEKDVVKLEWSRDAAGCHVCVMVWKGCPFDARLTSIILSGLRFWNGSHLITLFRSNKHNTNLIPFVRYLFSSLMRIRQDSI